MLQLLAITVVIVLSGVGVLGDYFIKTSGNGPRYINVPLFISGMAIYALTAFGWFYVMKHIKLSILGTFYSLTTAILLALVGAIFFREQLNTYTIFGIILGLIAIIILGKFS